MNAKKYQAPTIGEAIAEVKRDLGRDAVILQTRSFRKGGLFGIGGRRTWEIVAAQNVNVPQQPFSGTYVSEGAPAEPAEPPDQTEQGRTPRSGESELVEQVRQLRTMVETLLGPGGRGKTRRPPVLRRLHSHLLAQDVDTQIAGDLTRELELKLTGRQLDDESFVRGELQTLIASRISTCRASDAGRGRRVMAFVGPTGVGKTTTIAKLAAGFKLAEHKSVGLITIDTYRIAAVDQLRTYAEIIEVPLSAVLSAGELDRTLRQMADMDVVLIDTTGRSPGDDLKLNQLRSFISVAEAAEVHLVVSATASRAGLERAAEKFLPLGVNRIILSKIDEAATFGVILSVAAAGHAPFSYCTCGQEVPDDISPAKADDLAHLIMGDPGK